jgi:16S rRNA (cytidine1402-2'-O)-methyltransferase
LAKGKRIALISDAGMPLVSDPGFKLVRAVAAAEQTVTVLPGASALTTALAGSGLPTDAFFFAGFLPLKQAARRTRLAEIKDVPGTLIFFESPQRAAESLNDMAAVLGNRPAVMARELTKLHEENVRGTLEALARDIAARGDLKGEIVLLAGPPLEQTIDDDMIRAHLSKLLPAMSVKDAAKAISSELNVPKSRVYALGLQVKGEAQ